MENSRTQFVIVVIFSHRSKNILFVTDTFKNLGHGTWDNLGHGTSLNLNAI